MGSGARRCRGRTCGSRSNRRARWWRCGVSCSWRSLASRATAAGVALARSVVQRLRADRALVVTPLADRRAETDALLQDHAHRTDFHRLVGERDVGVLEQAGFRIDDEMLVDAASGQCKY